ncbi:MAG: DUF3592 domain-containing protein [Gammaproteobacteria bacterium]|nr:DUF3592 domain-containing protein [Gammaproteobacteria bacterium]
MGALLFIIFLLVGLTLSIHTLLVIYKNNKAQKWPIVSCTVLESYLKKVEHNDAGHYGGGYEYLPVIKYQYTLNGRSYKSKKIYFNATPYVGYDQAKKLVDQYAKGSSNIAYCNPSNPKQAVLSLDRDKRGIFWQIVGAIFSLGFAYGIYKDL